MVTRLKTYRRTLIVTAAVGLLLAVALWPRAVEVEVGRVTRGPLVVTIDEDGQTRVHHRFVVSAPLAGRLERIDLDPGDVVRKDVTVVARLHPEPSPLLDARTRAEASAALGVARGAVGQSRADEQRAKAALDLARADLAREEALAASGLTTRQSLDTRRSALIAADEAANAARYAAASAAADLTRAQARLAPPAPDRGGRVVTVLAPVDGVVLRRSLDSETVVAAGASLLEIGDPSHVEVVVDLLSSDAVKVKPGMPATLVGWGGEAPLAAHVERVEPAGFTKVSALGVEEQRVNVILDVDDDRAAWTAMGDGFRVEARIAVWQTADAVKVPAAALVRVGEAWAAFVVDGGRARRVDVTIGHRTPAEVEVTAGLMPDAVVVVHPPDTLTGGQAVTIRQ